MKPAPLLLLRIQRKTQAGGINPTFTGLAQPPYGPLLKQNVCDLCQACGVGDMSKTVSFLCKADSGFARLTGHVLMTVEDDLGGECRVAADLDGDVAPNRDRGYERSSG